MHIKQIVLRNFKSYREEIITDISKEINVVIGKNGHGKSNFYKALAFIFASPSDDSLREARQNYLSHDRQDDNEDIYVEIHLDNTQREVPIETDQLVIRKVLRPDSSIEYLLNGKKVPNKEIENVFACFGVASKSSHYFVPQGRLSEIAVMNEEEIFATFQEVIGFSQYEQKRKECTRNLEAAAKEKEEIEECLDELKGSIQSLNAEYESFQESEAYNKRIKSMEFALYHKQIEELQEKIEKIRVEYSKKTEKSLEIQNEEINKHERKSALKKQEESLKSKLGRLQGEKGILAAEVSSWKAKLREINTKIKELNSQKGRDGGKVSQDLDQKLKEIRDELGKLRVAKQQSEKEVLELKRSLIQKGIKAFAGELKDTPTAANLLQESERKEQELAKLSEALRRQEEEYEIASRALNDHQKDKRELLERLKEVQLKIYTGTARLEEKKKSAQTLELELDVSFKESYLSNVIKVYKQAKNEGVAGVHGILADLLDIPEELHICCDTILKKKLYSLVVDNLETASRIIAINKRLKGKEIIVYPLTMFDDFKDFRQEYPDTQDAVIVVESIKQKEGDFPYDLQPLINDLFGRILLTRNYKVALKFSKQYNLTCLTTQGEIVYPGSYLTKVGFNESRKEVFQLYKAYSALTDEAEKTSRELEALDREKEDLGNKATRIEREILAGLKNKILLEGELRRLKEEIQLKKFDKQEQERSLALEDLDDVRLGMLAKREDLGAREKELVKQLGEKLQQRKELVARIEALSERVDSTEAERVQAYQTSEAAKALEMLKEEKATIEASLEKRMQDLASLEQNFQAADFELNKVQESLDRLAAEFSQLQIKKSSEGEELSNLNRKRIELIDLKDELLDKKSKIYVDEANAIDEFANLSTKQILANIEKMKTGSKKAYTAKDKAVFSQLEVLKEKLEGFTTRLESLDRTSESLNQIKGEFDSLHQETIAKVFKNFSTYFEKFFRRISGDGVSSVKLIKDSKGKYSGIDLKVKFYGEGDEEGKEDRETRRTTRKSVDTAVGLSSMGHLSTGQKSVVAMTIIFALQHCDPAPFYFFDEFDSAMDKTYRQAIYQIIQENAKRAQYFISSFQPDIVDFLDANYILVSLSNNISTTKQITREEATEFFAP